MNPGCAGGRGFAPDQGNSNKSFSSCQETGKGFLFWNALIFQILNSEVVPVGKCKLQIICVSLLWDIQPR